MREIKFRAWNIPNKLMYQNVENGLIAENEKGQLVIGVSLGKLSKDVGSVLMQFTGVKDKNGKEIYEDDICKVTYYNHSTPNTEIIQVVKYELGTFSLRKQNSNSELEEDRTNVPLYYCFSPNKIEVIGNIYENPELLNTLVGSQPDA